MSNADASVTADVFISYAGADRAIAADMARALEACGLRVWWDAKLEPGERFEQRVQQVVARARIIVALLSRAALASDWVRWEIAQAQTNGLRVVPVLFGGADPASLPPPLTLVQSVVLAGDRDGLSLEEAASLVQRIAVTTERRESGYRAELRRRTASRRLAAAAAVTARRAAQIKRRNRARKADASVLDAPHIIRCTASAGFGAFLDRNAVSVAVTLSDADRILLLGCDDDGEVHVHVDSLPRPTGLLFHEGSLMAASQGQIIRFENILRGTQTVGGSYTHYFLPRAAHLTGALDIHDLGIHLDGHVVFASARYSCLATLSRVHSFKSVWTPSFISALVAEDRCHLNGLAMDAGTPAFATAFSSSDCFEGWRDDVADGGIAIDVRRDRVVCSALTMPHSPRLHHGRLWLLNSGRGELGVVDELAAPDVAFRPVAACSGFTRGLGFVGDHALVGVSRPRYGTFEGLELERQLELAGRTPWTGIAVVDVGTGATVEWLAFGGEGREIHDLAVMPGVRRALSASTSDDELLQMVTME